MLQKHRGYALESSYRILFNRVSISKDLGRGPYAIILNSLNMIIRTTVASNASPLLKSTRFPYKYPKIGIFTLVYYPRG